MNPKKYRRAKLKRRRSYEDIVERKVRLAERQMMRLTEQMLQAKQNARREKARADSIQAATEGLLHSRLVVKAVEHNVNRTVVAIYDHPDMVHPVNCFHQLSVLLAEAPPPYEDFNRVDRVRVSPFSVGADMDMQFMLTRSHPNLMQTVMDCSDHIGRLISRMILGNLMKLASLEANR